MPDVLDTASFYDEIIPVENEDGFFAGREIGKNEGVLVGISSGAAVHAAIELAKRPKNEGKTIVVLPARYRGQISFHPAFCGISHDSINKGQICAAGNGRSGRARLG